MALILRANWPVDPPRADGYTLLLTVGGNMVRYQVQPRPHEVNIQVLRHERKTEKLHLHKLQEDLKLKLPPISVEAEQKTNVA